MVLGARADAPNAVAATTAEVPSSAARLTAATRKRGRRAWVVVLIVLLLAGLAAAVGWYFALGPGARIGVADVVNLDRASAVAALEKQGFTVGTDQTAFSTTVDSGKVAGTDPPAGTSLDPGATVALKISQGREQFDIPKFTGQTESDAKTLVRSHWTSKASSQLYSADLPKGTVISALDDAGTALAEGAKYGEKLPIQLVVSAGPIPDVAGKTVDEATAALTGVGLQVGTSPKSENSETEAENAVIRIDGDTSALKPNDTVTLVVSSGPPPVQIPADIVGKNWATAKKQLSDLGLKVDYNNKGLADFSPGSFTVQSIDPVAGSTVPKGSTVKVKLTLNGS